MIDYELSYSVTDLEAVSPAQNDLFDRVYRADRSGRRSLYNTRLAGLPPRSGLQGNRRRWEFPNGCWEGISLFSNPDPRQRRLPLTSQMLRKE